MKRTLILAALAALTFASCQKNEVAVESGAESNAITFDVYSGRSVTKAETTNVMGVDTLKDKGFGVFAFYTAQTSWKDYSFSTPNFMNNQLVKWESTKWAYTPIKYWPNNTNDKISFFAYAPYNSTNTWKSDTTTHFTVNKDVKGQVDFLFAPGLKDKTKQSGRDSLQFKFKHALSRVGLKVAYVRDSTTYEKANGAKIEDATKIVIDSVILIPVGGFYKEGDINLNRDTAAWTPGTNTTIDSLKLCSKDNFKRDSAATVAHAAGQIVTEKLDTLNNDNSYMMIIPQDFSTNGINVVVKYHVWTKDSNLSSTAADAYSKITNKVTTLFKPKFLAGKAYTLNLLLGVNSVKIKAEVEDWNVQTATDIYLPANE